MSEYLCGRKVIHIRKDGTRQDSMEGVVVPVTDATMPFYHMIERAMERETESKQEVS